MLLPDISEIRERCASCCKWKPEKFSKATSVLLRKRRTIKTNKHDSSHAIAWAVL